MTKENEENLTRMGRTLLDKLLGARQEVMDAHWMSGLSGLDSTVIELEKIIADINKSIQTVRDSIEKNF